VVFPEPEHPMTDTRMPRSVGASTRALDRVAEPEWTACPIRSAEERA
jgi:hypothetical protein